MKKQSGLYSILLDIPQTVLVTWPLKNFSNNLVRTFYLTFISSFLLVSVAVAQPTSTSNTQNEPDITAKFKSNKESKTMKRELREEKESTKAVENIPQRVFTDFNTQFPKAKDVEWSAPGQFSEADFMLNNRSKIANYDYSGKLVGVGTYLKYSQVPFKGREHIAKDYKGYTPVQTMFYDDNEDNDINANLFGIPIQRDGYFVQLKRGNNQIVLQVEKDGEVSYFSDVR